MGVPPGIPDISIIIAPTNTNAISVSPSDFLSARLSIGFTSFPVSCLAKSYSSYKTCQV